MLTAFYFTKRVYLLKGFDFYLTVKAALRHNSADSELDHEGLGCNLGQNQQNQYTAIPKKRSLMNGFVLNLK